MYKGTKVLFDLCPFDTQRNRSRPRRTWPSGQAGDAGRGASNSEVRTRHGRSDTREGRGVTPREGGGSGGGPKSLGGAGFDGAGGLTDVKVRAFHAHAMNARGTQA